LESRSKWFKWVGSTLGLLAILVFISTAYISYDKISDQNSTSSLLKNALEINTTQATTAIKISISAYLPIFVKSFTFYGLMILLAATLWKLSKAFFDQSERLLSKRRIDRLLRLYIHLNDAKASTDDIKEILGFEKEKNAFTDIKAEAKAPWGNIISDLLDTMKIVAKENKYNHSHHHESSKNHDHSHKD